MNKYFLFFICWLDIGLANELSLFFKNLVDKKSEVYVYCRPAAFFYKAPDKDFIQKYGIKKTYTLSRYVSLSKALLAYRVEKVSAQSKSSVDMVLKTPSNQSIVVKTNLSGKVNRVIIDNQEYISDSAILLLETFCPESKKFLEAPFIVD